MPRRTWLARSFAFAAFGLALAAPGCGPAPIEPENATSIPVANPSPDNKFKDVTLENESQHLDKIGGISK